MIRMNRNRHRKRNFSSTSLFIFLGFLFINIPPGFSQIIQDQQKIYFISDCQAPMWIEKVFSKEKGNEASTDSLFADIFRQHPKNLFMLGDHISKGSKEKSWTRVDTFLKHLNKTKTNVYAIPGNHEYMGNSSRGMKQFKKRFPEQWLFGYCVNVDSIAIVLLNSNFKELNEHELLRQLTWYKSAMDSLDSDPATKIMIVCTHHPSETYSSVVKPSQQVEETFVPRFKKSKKSKLFISGHSHNLEYFADSKGDKHFLVIGGGGGIKQPLKSVENLNYHDLLKQSEKPRFFYIVIEKNGNSLKLIAKGFRYDRRFFELNIDLLKLDNN